MKVELIRTAIVSCLREVAPESNPEAIPRDANLRAELDLDSMDFLQFVTALHRALHVEVPERDYGRLATLEQAERYLAEHTP